LFLFSEAYGVGVAGVALFPALDDTVKSRTGDESYVFRRPADDDDV
jgi:hypothetical protein